jgi:hypothetical protein
MALKLRLVRRLTMVALIGAQSLATIARAVEPAGAITEIDVRGGQAEVRRQSLQDWRPAGPLLSLNAGDTVRVSRDASVVVLLTGGRGSVKVDATNSPFEIPAPTVEQTKLTRGWILLEESVKALLKLSHDSAATTLGTRGHASPLVVLTPHNGVVLPDSLVFEWVGGQSPRYSIRVVGPSGLVLERTAIAGMKFVYPADAAPLTPGVLYQVQVTSGAERPAKAWFEVMDPTRAETIHQDLSELVAAAGSTVSPNTLVATQVAYLASQGLLLDARLMLMAALADKPDEATFHFLLGNLYERLGLPQQAAESFGEARFLGMGRAQR